MITLDVFNNDAFSVTTMLDPVNLMPTVPAFLGSLGIFNDEPVATDTIGIGRKETDLNLIQTTQRGAPIEILDPEDKNYRPFKIPRIAKGSKIRASELANVIPGPDSNEVETAMARLARDQQRLKQDVVYTDEFHMLGAIQGVLLDADGAVLVDYYDEWDIAVPDDIEVDFTLDGGELAELFRNQIERPLIRTAKTGQGVSRVVALTGDEYWDKLLRNPEVRETYLHWQAAADLRNQSAFQTFRYGNVEWINYRGSDDNSTIAVDVDEAVIFPTGVPGMFRKVLGPGETIETVNRMGRDVYPLIVWDKDRNMWIQPEIYAYHLHLNTRPDLVLRATIAG